MPPLAPAWLDYRDRVATLVLGIAGIALWLGGLDVAARDLVATDTAVHALEAAWTTATVAALGWLGAFRCPSCGNHFHFTLWLANPIPSECLHCGFPKWRDPRPARERALR